MTESASVTEPLDRVRAALANRYVVERELGRGGMATVYLAHDPKHGRAVAIKVLHPDLAASLGAERFLREIQTAARLQHPHILPLHDSGDTGGLLYYVMPYVEGQSLRAHLDRHRQLPLEETLKITRQIAEALAYAHAHDVVHRDIKPENILFSGGDDASGGALPLIADFGVARAITGTGNATLTQRGMAVGTPSYMSPEQATGEQAVDGRADTYALACVAYEMLAGHPPFLGATAQEILARHSLDPVPPLRTVRPDLPEYVERAVMKALAKSPADRFPTATAFAAALAPSSGTPMRARKTRRGLVLAVLAVGAAVAAVSFLLPWDRRLSIAVLAFTNVNNDVANEALSDGVAEELTNALVKVPELDVAGRTSAFAFKGKGLDPREIGRRLGVRYVVNGSLRSAVNRRRVGVQLIDVSNGREIWSGDFEHDALNRDVFTAQDSITRSILRQLLPHLSHARVLSSLKRGTENPEAHELYLKGRFFFGERGDSSLKKAQAYFKQAIAKDPSYALAYAGLSDAYSHASVFGYAPPDSNFPQARTYASQALKLDSTLADAHASAAFIALFYDWNWPAATREFDAALTLDPQSSSAHLWHAWYFLAMGKRDDAIAEARWAVEHDAYAPVNNTRLISILFYGGHLDAALAQALKTTEMFPDFVGARSELARVYAFMGRCSEALAELERAKAAEAAQLRGVPGYTYAMCGRRPSALAELDRFNADIRDGKYVSHYGLAVIQAGLGNKDLAFVELEKAFTERAWTMFLLGVDPAFDRLRSDPRFASLVGRMRLPSVH